MAKKTIDGYEINDDLSNQLDSINNIKANAKTEFEQTVEQAYSPTRLDVGGDFGESKYDEGMLLSQIDDYQRVRAERQPGSEQAFRAISGGLYKGVLTAAEDIGYLLDIENNVSRLAGIEEIESNQFSTWAKEAKENYDENHPIYRYNPEKIIDFADPGFYWSALQGVVDSAVGFGIVGAGAGATVGRGLKGIAKLAKAGIPVQNMIATAGTALTTNYAEGKMMALEMFTSTVDTRMKDYDIKAFDKAFKLAVNMNPGIDPGQASTAAEKLLGTEAYQAERSAVEKEIRSVAGDEANTFQKRNMAFMASDALAINGMFRGVGSTRNLLKAKSLKNTMGMIAKQAPTEYIEEVGQGMAQKEAEYQALKNVGMDSEISSDPMKRAWEFFTDPQTQLEGAMGLFGGPVQHVLVQGPSNLANKGADTEYRVQQEAQVAQNDELINTLMTKRTKVEQAKQSAVKNGDVESFAAIVNDDFADVAYRNFTSGSTENLENHLKEVSEMSLEEATENGFEETYKQDAEKSLEELQKYEKTYLKIQRKHSDNKDYLVHKKIYDLETKRNTITPLIANLKSQKQNLLNTIQQEVKVLEDVNISTNQMKYKNADLIYKSLVETKKKLTATKNEALLKPNARFKSKQQELITKQKQLVTAKKHPYKYSQEEITGINNEVNSLQQEVNRLSQFTDEKTKNKTLNAKVEKSYNSQAEKLDKEIETIGKAREVVKNKLKDNKEKINAFKNEDYAQWDEVVATQEKLDNFTQAKKLYDDEYKDVINNKDEHIAAIEKQIKDENIESSQKKVDDAKTTEAKKEVIATEPDSVTKEQLEKDNVKKIQNQERKEREDELKSQLTLSNEEVEELKTTETTDEVVNETVLDDNTIEEIKQEVKNVQDETAQSNAEVVGTEVNETIYEGKRVEKGFNLLAYLSRLYNKITNGEKVSKEDINDELNENSFIKLLNPNKYGKGTKVSLDVTNDDTIIINAETGQTWGEFNKSLDIESNEYINNVPITVKDEENNIIGYLHQDNWISEENVYGNVVDAKTKLKTIRKRIVEQGRFDTTINSKSIGYFFRSVDGTQKVSEAIKDESVVFAIGAKEGLFANKNLDNLNITNKDRIVPGYTYMVVQVGADETGKLYTAMPLLNTKLSESDQLEQVQSTVSNAIKIYYKLKRKEEGVELIELTPDENAVYVTLGKNGIDLGSHIGLSNYINQFLQVTFTGGRDLKDIVKESTNKLDRTLLSITAQQIQFAHRAGKFGFINPLNTTTEKMEEAINKIVNEVIPFMYANTDKKAIQGEDKAVKMITSSTEGNLSIEDVFDTYTDYVKENTKTDILGQKVDVENGKDIYAYTIQPKVELDFTEIIPIEPEKKEVKETKPVDTEPTIDETGFAEPFSDGIDPNMSAEDFGFPDIDFLPSIEQDVIEDFTVMSRNVIVENLNVNTQTAIVDFLFKEALTAIISNPKQAINVNKIYSKIFIGIEQAMIIQKKNIPLYEDNIKLAQNKGMADKEVEFKRALFNSMATVKLYENYLLNKEQLKQLSDNQLKADNLVDISEDGDIVNLDEKTNSKVHNDKSSYETDKSDSMSRVIKRFLSGVRAYNANGTPQKSMLNKDKLMNYEEVYRQLQVVTADKEPDYDNLLATIKESTAIFPFFKDVITKLEDDTNPDIEAIRNQMVVLLNNHYSNSKFIIYREKNSKYDLIITNSNSNAVDESIREGWTSFFNQSNLVLTKKDGESIVDSNVANELILQYNTFKNNIPTEATPEVKEWLGKFGIQLDDKTWKALVNGEFKYKSKKISWESQFKSGIFNILATSYFKEAKGKDSLDNSPMNQTIVKVLSRLDGKNSLNFHSNSQREGVKTVYSFNTNKLITDTTRAFRQVAKSTDSNGNEVYTNKLLTDKLKVIFNQNSGWLNNMVKRGEDGKPEYAKNGQVIVDMNSSMYQNLKFFTMSLEALKKQGAQSRDNRDLGKLSAGEIELTKLGLITAKQEDESGNNERIISLLYPTTSDKTTVMGLSAKAANVTFDFESGKIDQNTIGLIYNQLVLPEIERIMLIEKLQNSDKNINLEKNYIQGGKQFLLLPAINNIEGLFNKDGSINSNVQTDVNLRTEIDNVIKQYVEQLTQEKLDVWIDNGIITNAKKNVFIDQSFYNGFDKAAIDNKVDAIAADMVVQYLIGNANIFQTYIGDPALFYKNSVEETFINIGKRLAGDIAPGEQGNGSLNDIYKQGFVKDRKTASLVQESLRNILGDKADAYGEINATDAQEITTFIEKLYMMNMHGKIAMDGLYAKVHDIVTEEISNGNHDYVPALKSVLTKKEYKYLKNITLQPDKPVYVKNIIDSELGIERRLYIKSSSFALSPFLTKGTELEKIRVAMERDGVARLAYDSAVKVGNVAESSQLWDENGNVVENLTFDETNTLTIPRSGLRIQQEVPYDVFKEAINKVSQASKNLFVNILNVDGFAVDWMNNGKSVTGAALNDEYIGLYKQLFDRQQKDLFEELGYDPATNELEITKLKEILKEESISRNYPIADLQSFDLDNELRFLAFSPSGQKFEALLNSIVTNRIIKMKFPGKSYVLGSEEGFKTKAIEDLNLDEMSITFTKNWTGSLQAADGTGRPDQVIMPWDFKDNIETYIGEDGLIDQTKIPTKLLSRFGMRIPNQGPNSQAKIQVVGFLAPNQGDLLIAPREFVIRMGSDFDVDKLYIYKYDYSIVESGMEVLDSKNYDMTRIDNDIEIIKENLKSAVNNKKELKNIINNKQDWVNTVFEQLAGKKEWGDITEINTLKEFLGDASEDIMFYINKLDTLKKLKKGKSDVFNKILDVHLAIHSNPDQRIQRQIHTPLDFWKLDVIAKEIGEDISAKKTKDKLFTGLSDEYQKQKFINASAGKALVGVFSNDSMFNALIQGKDMKLLGPRGSAYKLTFGKITSNGDLSNPYTLNTQHKLTKALKDTGFSPIEVNPYDYLSADEIVYKSEVISGFQSAAVDNEKEQILDKINANSETSPVVKAMMLMGFEEETPYFLAQDIIRDYVEEVKKLRGLGDYVADVENTARNNVEEREEYKVEYIPTKHAKYGNSLLTISKMKSMIKGESVDNYKLTQQAILNKYFDIKIKGRTIGKVESTISIDSQGLGKSFFETLIRGEEIEELQSSIQNFEELVRGNSIPAMAIQYGLNTNNELWKRFLPYEKHSMKKSFLLLEQIYSKEESGRIARADFRTKMWNELKKYRYSDPNLFTKEEIVDPNYLNIERKRLFIDTSTNKSLAKIIQEIKKNNPNNTFIKALNTNIKKNGQPSTIKFRASSKEMSNETRLYEGIIDLLINEKNLGNKGEVYPAQGKENYTSRDLFQDLIWAAYLNGGIQEANQYVKYIPAGYLHLLPFASNIKEWINKLDTNDRFTITEDENDNMIPSIAVKQIIQNNPEQLPKLDIVVMNDTFVLESGDKDSPIYGSVYDQSLPTGSKKFRLYEMIGIVQNEKGKWIPEYTELPVVGTSGKDKLSEYNYLNNGYTTSVFGVQDEKDRKVIINEGVIPTSGPTKPATKMKSPKKDSEVTAKKIGLVDTYKNNNVTGKQVVKDTLTKISNNSIDPYNKLAATALLESIDNMNLDKLKIQLTPILKMDTGATAAGQVTTMPSGVVKLSINTGIASHNDIAQMEYTFLHELTHVATKQAIINPNTIEQKKIVANLNKLREQLKNYFETSDEHKEAYKVYMNSNKKVNNDIDAAYYATTNTKEFAAVMMTNGVVQTLTNDIQVADKSIFENFVNSIIDMLKTLGINIKKGSVLEASMESIISLLQTNNVEKKIEIDNNELFGLKEDIEKGLFDDDGYIRDTDLLPEFAPSTRQTMAQFNELNEDGTPKKLAVTDNNAHVMLKRAQKINQGQAYYKATFDKTMGEEVSSRSGREYYRIYLAVREEMKDLNYVADLVPQKVLDEMKKQCK